MTNFGNRADCVILLKQISCSILISLDMFMGSYLFCQDSFLTVVVAENECFLRPSPGRQSPSHLPWPWTWHSGGSYGKIGQGAPQRWGMDTYKDYLRAFNGRKGHILKVLWFPRIFQRFQMVFSYKHIVIWPQVAQVVASCSNIVEGKKQQFGSKRTTFFFFL